MQHRLPCLLLLLTLLAALGTGERSETSAQNRPAPNTPAIQIVSDPIETAHDYYHERRYAEAIAAYETLIEKGIARQNGTYTPLRQSQKDSLRLMLGQSYAKTGEDPAAQRVFKEVIDENPNGSYATQAVHRLGNLHWERYQFREAIIQCKRILKQHPDTAAAATAAYLVGKYQQTNGQSAEAMESYTYFLENFPKSPYRVTVFNSLVQLYTTSQRYGEAEKLIQERMQQHPEDFTLLEQLAELYQQRNAHQEAIDLYRSALQQNPQNAQLRKKLGALYAETGQTAQAVTEWEQIVAGEVNEAEQQQQLGEIYLSHKMYPEAVAAYQQAIRLRPQNSFLYTQLAAAHKIQGDMATAASVYVDALQQIGLTRNQREGIWNGMLDIYEGELYRPIRDRLIAEMRERRSQNPENPKIVMTLAELLFHEGDVSDALALFTHLYQNYPTHIDTTLERYAAVLERNENPAAADFYEALINGSISRTRARNARTKLANFHEKQGRWRDAIAVLADLERAGEASVKDRVRLGTLQLQRARTPETAQNTFRDLLTQRLPTSQLQAAQLGLATCHILLADYTAAREILEPLAARTGSARAVARKLLGDSYFFAYDFEKASATYKTVIGTSKSDRLTNDAIEQVVLIQNHTDYLNIPLTDYADAVRLYLNGETADALRQCKQTLEAYPEATILDKVWLLIGDIHRETDSGTEAIHAYQEVVARAGLIAPKALLKIAETYRGQADLDSAAATYTTLITEFPEESIAVHARQQLDAILKIQQKR